MQRTTVNPWATLVTLSLGFFMVMLDLTIVNVAIPSLSADLHASLGDVGWIVNGYVIVLAVLLITAGRLGDLRGPRNLLLLGVAVFTVSSIACGLAQSPGQLVAARVAQGLGAALLLPQTMAIIIATFPPQRRGAALGVWGAVSGLATIAGPTVGGLLVTTANWRWVFFINVPIGILVIVLGMWLLPDLRTERRAPLDLKGVALASVGLVLLTFGLLEGQHYRWGTVWHVVSIPLILGAGVLFLVLFVVDQARRQDRQPLLPFALFRDRNYTLMNVANAMVSVSMMATFLPLSIYMQSTLHFSALKTGLSMAPLAIVSMLTAPAAGRLVDRIGGKYLLLAGLLLFGAGVGYVALVARPDSTWSVFLPGFLIGGLGLGSTFGPMQTIATYQVPPQLAGAASGVLNTMRQFGSVLGGVLTIAVLQQGLASGATFTSALRPTLLITVGAMVVGAALCLWVRQPAPTVDLPDAPLTPALPGRRPATA